MPINRPPDARPVNPARHSAVIEAVTAATVTTFEELCQTPVVPGEPYLSRIVPLVDAVTAEITLRRDVPGRLVLAFPRQVLGVFASRYLAGEVVTPEIADDTAGEFANVIAGQAKTMLHGTPYHFHLSTPRVGVTTSSATDAPDFLVLTFDCDAGIFAVHVYLPFSDSDNQFARIVSAGVASFWAVSASANRIFRYAIVRLEWKPRSSIKSKKKALPARSLKGP